MTKCLNDSMVEVLNSLRMRTDILPLCDQHYRTMEPALAPYNTDYSIEFFRCTDKFCHRCFGERIGYTTPKRGGAPVLAPTPPTRARHPRAQARRGASPRPQPAHLRTPRTPHVYRQPRPPAQSRDLRLPRIRLRRAGSKDVTHVAQTLPST